MSPRKYTAADLIPGKTYRVVNAFRDYDGRSHDVGETWRFVRQSFLPHEDGLSLFVEKEGLQVHIRLQWRADAQAKIIDGFSDLVEEI
jgi:hypothetical protein